jgi:hypothetical protein
MVGQSIGHIHSIVSCRELLSTMHDEAVAHLRRAVSLQAERASVRPGWRYTREPISGQAPAGALRTFRRTPCLNGSRQGRAAA